MSLPTEAQCKRAASHFNDVVEPAFRYAERKRLVARPFAAYREAADLWEGFPEGWEENVLGMLAAGAVFTRPDRVAAFLRGTKQTLRDELATMVRRWRTRPWAYSFFEVVEDLGDRRLLVTPVGSPPSGWSDPGAWDELLVYSPVVTDNYRRGATLFFAQLADTGPAYVTYGAVIPFTGLDRADVLFAADVIAHADDPPGAVPLLGVANSDISVSDLAASDPIPFLAMLRWSETPPVRTPRGVPGRYAAWTDLPDLPDAFSEQVWRDAARTAGEDIAAIVFDDDGGALTIGEGSPMYDPAIYLSRETGHGFLEARTREGYDRGREAAAAVIEFPEHPEVSTVLTTVAAMARVTGLDETLLDECAVTRERYQDAIVGSGPPDGAVDEEASEEALPTSVEEFQAIADRLLANHNEGRHEESEAIAAALGVAPAVVDSVRRNLEGVLSRMSERTAGLPGADRFGLSPKTFSQLTRRGEPDVAGVLCLNAAEEIRHEWRSAAQAPCCRAVGWLLDCAMGERGLPATQAGYVAPAIVAQAYDEEVFPSATDASTDARERFRPKKEGDWFEFLRARRLAESARLLRLSGRRFEPTETAWRLADDPAALYHHLLETAFRTFEWAEARYFDPPVYLHEMAGFLFYAAGELCRARREPPANPNDAAWVPVEALVDRFIAAVPQLAAAVQAEHTDTGEPFGLRGWTLVVVSMFFVDHLGVSFGLLETDGGYGTSERFRTTRLYDVVFERS
jgi:hypothetical protein